MTIPMPRPPAVPAAVDGQAFRDAMSRIATAVHVVTTDGPSGRAGATMTAVTSVTDRPPTLLACLNAASRANGLVKANRVLCVSTLGVEHGRLAEIFAGRTGMHGEDRFAEGRWSALATGAPALDGARVALDCRVVEASEVGTHTVFLAEVVAVRLGPAGTPLVYVDRAYARVD